MANSSFSISPSWFLTNSKNSQGVVFHKFYNKKIYNQAIKEYKKFVEQITGKKVLTKVKLDPDAVDPDDVEMLEDLIMVAVNDAMKKADDASSSAMSRMTGGMGGFPF